MAVRSGLTKRRMSDAIENLITLGKFISNSGMLSIARATKELHKIAERIRINSENSQAGGNETKKKWAQIRNNNNGPTGPVGPPVGPVSASPLYPPSAKVKKESVAGATREPSPPIDPVKTKGSPEIRINPPAPPNPPPEAIREAPPVAIYATAKHELWGEGKRYLTELGIAPSAAGPLIGRWLKESGDDCAGVLDAIRRAAQFRPQEVVAWINRVLPSVSNRSTDNVRRRSVQDAMREYREKLERGEPTIEYFDDRPIRQMHS